MNKKIGMAALAAVVASFFSITAYAFHGGHEGHHGGGPEMAINAVLTPAQHQQVHKIFQAEMPTMKNLHQQLQAARKALITKLLSQGQTVDITAEVAQLKQAQAAMMDERIKIALAERAILSSQQLQQASQLWTSLESLHQQEHDLIKQARQAAGATESPETGTGE